MNEIHPAAREIIAALGRIGQRAASAAISTVLKSGAEIGSHLAEALTKSAEAAEKMSRGEPYRNPFEEDSNRNDEDKDNE